jgi:hypothetical protein
MPRFDDDGLGPYRTLALRVISLAVRDLITPGTQASDRSTARAFLSGSGTLAHWCRLADIDPAAIRRGLHRVDENGVQPSSEWTLTDRAAITP